ncbi:MAG: disulfide bond formation protein B [Acinetobacter sp.]|nr:disulfide bond formation protein B [Acinetobacter sp.]
MRSIVQSSYLSVQAFLLFSCVVGMGFAYYLQYGQGYEPCPLCILQRVGVFGLMVFSLMSIIHRPKMFLFRRAYVFLGAVSILWSAGVAARHVWLQNLPADEVPSCGAGLDYLMETFPLMTVLREVLTGSGECAVIDWTFLGQSLPVWSFLFFGVLAVVSLWQLFRVYPQ